MKRNKLLRLCLSLVVAIALSLSAISSVWAAPPANDNFADAELIPGLPFSSVVDISEATTEAGEPQICTFMPQTVWYKLEPTASVAVRADTAGSSFSETHLTVYHATGPTISDLSFQGCASFGSSLVFSAQAGETYYIQAGNIFGSGGELHLNVQAIPPPANDNFAEAAVIGALPFDDPVDITGATLEANEPLPSCALGNNPGKTVWYAFTPLESGSLSTILTNTPFTPFVAAYTGASLGSLSEVGSRCFGNWLNFHAEAGTTYYIQAGSLHFGSGTGAFRLEVTPPPVAFFDINPSDPTVFDTVSFFDSGFDPVGVGVDRRVWDFGDGTTLTTNNFCCATHKYAVDGDYTVQLAVTTFDGRSASVTRLLPVRTHDVAVVKVEAPQSARIGQTRQISVYLRNTRYPENVRVELFKSTPGGFQLIGFLDQFIPVRPGNRTTLVGFSYTFTSQDAAIGKVNFKGVVSLSGVRDALPTDNELISSPPTRVN